MNGTMQMAASIAFIPLVRATTPVRTDWENEGVLRKADSLAEGGRLIADFTSFVAEENHHG